MFLTLDKQGNYRKYTHDEFFKEFDLRTVYLSSLYDHETLAISDLSVDFLADWYGFDSAELLEIETKDRYSNLFNLSVNGLLSLATNIIEDGFCEEYSCGNESVTYGDIIFIYSKKYKFKMEVRSIYAFDIVPAHTAGLFKDLEEATGLQIFVRS
jgi:hypothetical protein